MNIKLIAALTSRTLDGFTNCLFLFLKCSHRLHFEQRLACLCGCARLCEYSTPV